MTVLHDLTVREQRDALRKGAVSSVELTAHYLDRAERLGPDLGAFVEVTRELAETEALAADVRLRDGDDAPLLGVPTAFKDLHPVAGVRIRLGCKGISTVPTADGPVVGRLRQAGVVTLGTTHAPELGPTCFTESDVVDRPAVTPYDVTRYASGSSGGGAAAVAAGLVPFAHASDGAGSIRTPAAVCALVGFKASRGLLPLGPGASFLSMAAEGVVSRTVEDTMLALAVTAGFHGLYGLGVGLGSPPARRPLRVLRFTDSGFDDPHPEVVRAVEDAAGLLSALGHQVIDGGHPSPWTAASEQAMLVVHTASIAAGARALMALGCPEDELAPYTRWGMEFAEQFGVPEFLNAQAILATAAGAALEAFASYDVVLSPTSAGPPVLVGGFGVGEECARRMLRWSAYTPLANQSGLPAVSLPLHVTPEGLPIGVQLTGARVGDDALLLALCTEVEEASPFGDRHPPQWSA